MKTTVDIADSLLEQARRVASKEGTTLKALVEDGLRRVIDERAARPAFRLRRAAFKGRGLQPGVAGQGWDRIRDLAYGERDS